MSERESGGERTRMREKERLDFNQVQAPDFQLPTLRLLPPDYSAVDNDSEKFFRS